MNDVIKFNIETTYNWYDSTELNFMFVRRVFLHIKEHFHKIGYVYLASIYDFLGVEWNPDRENHCIRKDKHNLEFDVTQDNIGYTITITW